MLAITAPLLHSLTPRLHLHGGSGGDLPLRSRRAGCLIMSATTEANNPVVSNTVFEPFEEVKKELLLVPTVPHASLARHVYSDPCEAAINDQIKYIFIFLVFFSFPSFIVFLHIYLYIYKLVGVVGSLSMCV